MIIKTHRNFYHGDLDHLNDQDDNFLCCCEYFNMKNERSHLLGCCCDCQDVDEYFERSITRQAMPHNIYCNICRTIQDRCRIPWKGGAKKIPLDILLPIILQPVLALIAAINCWFTFVVFLALPFIVCYFMKLFETHNRSTHFFFSWTLTSCALLVIVFEHLVVPQLEILAIENFALLMFVLLAMLFIYLTRSVSLKSVGEYCENQEDESCSENERYCRSCKMKQPLRSQHCSICGYCVVKWEYHCIWLDCCIGDHNLSKYLLTLLFSTIALFYGSYLILTTVCHPFLVLNAILIPDDCTDVFFDIDLALCFVSSAYSLLVAAVLVFVLIRHCWLKTRGITYSEWLQLPLGEHRCCGVKMFKPFSRGAFTNLRDYITV